MGRGRTRGFITRGAGNRQSDTDSGYLDKQEPHYHPDQTTLPANIHTRYRYAGKCREAGCYAGQVRDLPWHQYFYHGAQKPKHEYETPGYPG